MHTVGAVKHKEIGLRAYLDTEEVSDKASFEVIIQAAERHEGAFVDGSALHQKQEHNNHTIRRNPEGFHKYGLPTWRRYGLCCGTRWWINFSGNSVGVIIMQQDKETSQS
jgi:hypothetical protein